jgi:hypothetical protein
MKRHVESPVNEVRFHYNRNSVRQSHDHYAAWLVCHNQKAFYTIVQDARKARTCYDGRLYNDQGTTRSETTT